MPAINTDYCYGAARRFGFCLFVYALARAVHIFAFPIRVFLNTSRLRLIHSRPPHLGAADRITTEGIWLDSSRTSRFA